MDDRFNRTSSSVRDMSESGGFLKLCTLFGLATTLDRKWLGLFNLYPIFVFLSLNGCILAGLYIFLSNYERARLNIIISIVTFTKVASFVLLINHLFVFTRRRERWRSFLRDLSHVQGDLRRNGRLEFKVKKSLVAQALLTVVSGYVRYKMGIKREYHSYWNPSIVPHVLLVLMRFYVLLSAHLIESTTLALVSCCASLRARALRGDFRAVARSYLALYQLCKRSNEIFGWQAYLDLQIVALRLLSCVATVTELCAQTSINGHAVGSNVAFCALDVVLALKIILPADELRRAGRSLGTSCRGIALNGTADVRLRREFSSLSGTLRLHSLGTSAAGFYDVDRGALLGLASVVTTYFIVYLQFR